MNLKGFQGTSLLDFPGRVASLLFWGGCNLTCPFCHNPDLVEAPASLPTLDQDLVLMELSSRRPFIDGVVLTGGEPTLDPDLPDFLTEVKSLGLAVKLDTNGLAPEVVRTLLDRGLVDYLALDLKTVPQRYPELHPTPVAVSDLLETVAFSRGTKTCVEYRTTCIPGWVDEETIRSWGEQLRGASYWALQQFHPDHALADNLRHVPPYPPERLHSLAELARTYVSEVVVRGI